MSLYKLDKWAATAIVVANMVGTGVFTSLGFQLMDIDNAWAIAALWITGGLIALCGAFTYAEIGSYLVKNGGEYHYLSELFHPSVGFVSGFVSVIIGFAAPIAAACVAFGKYLSYAYSFSFSHSVVSLIILILVGCVHLLSIRAGGIFQKYVTAIKLMVMLVFIASFFYPNANPSVFEYNASAFFSHLISPAFAVSLIYVSYAYSGWNAAAYVAAEIEEPQKNLSKAIVTGTILVMFFYILLNLCFLYSTPVCELKGKVEIGIISAKYIFGNTLGNIVGALISLLLVSTISSMIIAAPRVLSRMGEDYAVLSFLSKTNRYRSPYASLLLIVLMSGILIVTASFEWLINFIGVTLIVFTILTASGIFILRKKKNYQPVYKTPLYPIVPVFFILMNIWILLYVSQKNISALFASFITILLGFIIYKIIK
ncbi:MAG: amino acid permease [Bacteroidia bacterium]